MAICVDDFLAAARRATGLTDFGGDEFLSGLGVVVSDMNGSSLPQAWAAQLKGLIASNLERRLQFIALRKRYPAVADEVIERPLFVIGLPRTGTSALVDLLAQDAAVRVPMQWEVIYLTEMQDKATWETDPRIAQVDERFEMEKSLNPVTAMGLHTYGASLPDECNALLTLNLYSPNISVFGHLPRYCEWIRLSRMSNPYNLHRAILQHLQYFGRGGRWTMKSPFHVFDLPGLLETYPDAIFVQTHRDPLQIIPSMSGLISAIRREGPGDAGRAVTGRELTEFWGTGLQRSMAARMDPAIDVRVLDLSHREMVKDPIGTVRAVYQRFNLPFTPDVEKRMKKWNQAPAQHMSPIRFKLDEFGLTEGDVEAAFGGYRARFGHLL